jgi:hypothetical protein
MCVQRTLEAFTIILTATQLLCVGSLHVGAHAAILETFIVPPGSFVRR